MYITDTLFSEGLVEQARDANLLYHEATFLDNLVDRAHATFHSTAREAGEFALKSSVNQLIIGHFSSRYENLEPLLNEAQSVFPKTILAIQGETINF